MDLFNRMFLRPCESIAGKVGMLIFEFSPFDAYDMKQSGRIMDSLSRFLGTLPTGWSYGVEIRNREFLTPAYFAMLSFHGITHIFNSRSDMPPIGEQMALPGSLTNLECVGARQLLKPGRKHQVAEVQPEVRRSAAQLVRQRRLSLPNRRTFLYFNNRLEGNGPRTIAAVLAMAAEAG